MKLPILPIYPTHPKTGALLVPLSHISINWGWNCRTPVRDKHGTVIGTADLGDGQTTFSELRASIQGPALPDLPTPEQAKTAYYQETPVVLRANTDERTRALMPWIIVAGFSRVEAIAQIAAQHGHEDPAVQAILRGGLSETEARALNIQENTARSPLGSADTVHGLALLIAEHHRLQEQASVPAPLPHPSHYATIIGKGAPWTARLMRIAQTLHPKVLERWRQAAVLVAVEQIEAVAFLPREQQEEAYKAIVQSTVRRVNVRHKSNAGWYKLALRQAAHLGGALGKLHREGVIVGDAEALADRIQTMVHGVPTVKPGRSDRDPSGVQHAARCKELRTVFLREWQRGYC